MSRYSEEAIDQLLTARSEITHEYHDLLVTLGRVTLNDSRADEHLKHGFLRRFGYLFRCIENAYSIIPPSFQGLPDRNQLIDTTINLHAFWINIFGAIDNLAWVWVKERRVLKSNGDELPDTWVGLKRSNTLVRESFSPVFRAYLEGTDNWFDEIEGYRDGLAHRIPLYIPPYRVLTADHERYRELDAQMFAAETNGEEYERLAREQDELKAFRPMMTHSYSERARPLMFHAQMIADYRLMAELARRLMDELARTP